MKSKKTKSILGICLFIVIIVIYIVYLGMTSDGLLDLLDFLPDWMATPIVLLAGLIFFLLLIIESYIG